MPFFLVDPNGVNLCDHCHVFGCWKLKHFKKGYKVTDCVTYTGDMKWYHLNVKQVSIEDFDLGNEGFHKAKRIGEHAEVVPV